MVSKLRISCQKMKKKLLTRKLDDNLPEEEDDYPAELKRFSLQELLLATDHFSGSNIVRKDEYGNVYKGLLGDGSLVGVKRMKEERTQGLVLQFQAEVEFSTIAMHPNVCCLRGFCATRNERLLVYPFMVNGDVASYMRDHSRPLLGWPIRKQIALGVARGLSHLHYHCPCTIIHRDVKAANVLLNNRFEAILSDFGLAKLKRDASITLEEMKRTSKWQGKSRIKDSYHNCCADDSPVTSAVRGTIGHIAPEYLSTGRCSTKTDVFAYGIMLLELCTGQRAFDLARLANDDDIMLLDWVKGLMMDKRLDMLVDSNMRGTDMEEVQELVQLALLCTAGSPSLRPNMSEVVGILIYGGSLADSTSHIYPKESFSPRDAAVDDGTWKRLWKAPIRECHKLLLWEIISKTLHIKSISNERFMMDEMKCNMCGSPESLEHMFMQCELVKQLWLQSRWAVRTEVLGNIPITEWISILLNAEMTFNLSIIEADELILFAAISFEFIWSFRHQKALIKGGERISKLPAIIDEISKSYQYQSVLLNG